MKYKITIDNKGKRLDVFVAEKKKKISRSFIQKMIRGGEIKVNGNISSPHYSLKEGEMVEVAKALKKLPEDEKISKKLPAETEGLFDKIKIAAETPNYLVIDKPVGLLVHGGESIREKTLVDWLLKKFPALKKVGDDPLRPGIVHRLDRDVSGLMVIAKTEDSFANLKKQFQKRSAEKEYTALVYGSIDGDNREITFPIKRSTSGYKMAAMPETSRRGNNTDLEGVRQAITSFSIIKKFINYTLLAIKIKTGRMHQIRVHMFAYGHPLVGDDLYSTKRTREMNKKLNTGRVYLASSRLAFTDLSGERKEYKIDLPDDFKEILKVVR
jgi:23S rRNA pseudouridine1911/1915/1917 synthase